MNSSMYIMGQNGARALRTMRNALWRLEKEETWGLSRFTEWHPRQTFLEEGEGVQRAEVVGKCL